jgi:serine protease Do
VSGSPAEEAGLRQGDIITKFDGQNVSSMEELKQLISAYQAGKEVKVTFERLGNGYEEQTITVTLGSQPDTSTKN